MNSKQAKFLTVCSCGRSGNWHFHQTGWMPAVLPTVKRAVAGGAGETDPSKPGLIGLDTFICGYCGSSALDVPKQEE